MVNTKLVISTMLDTLKTAFCCKRLTTFRQPSRVHLEYVKSENFEAISDNGKLGKLSLVLEYQILCLLLMY